MTKPFFGTVRSGSVRVVPSAATRVASPFTTVPAVVYSFTLLVTSVLPTLTAMLPGTRSMSVGVSISL